MAKGFLLRAGDFSDEGSLDKSGMSALADAVRSYWDAHPDTESQVLLDLHDIFFMDEDAMAELLTLQKQARRRPNVVFALVRPSRFVTSKLARLGITALFTIYPDTPG